jgi:hypothetical protein
VRRRRIDSRDSDADLSLQEWSRLNVGPGVFLKASRTKNVAEMFQHGSIISKLREAEIRLRQGDALQTDTGV